MLFMLFVIEVFVVCFLVLRLFMIYCLKMVLVVDCILGFEVLLLKLVVLLLNEWVFGVNCLRERMFCENIGRYLICLVVIGVVIEVCCIFIVLDWVIISIFFIFIVVFCIWKLSFRICLIISLVFCFFIV